MAIFEIFSKLDKRVRLTELQWVHITVKHPELDNQISKIIDALEHPDFICYCPQEENYHHYKYFSTTPVTQKYLLVIVKYLNGEGFVISAFFVSKIRKGGKEVIYGTEDFNKLR